MRAYVLAYIFPGTPDRKPDRARIDAAMPNVERQMDILDKAITRTGYIAGNSFTIADMTLVPILAAANQFPESSAALAKRSNLLKYLQTHLARASVQKAAPPPR